MATVWTTAAYAMNTFAFEALNGFSPFQLVFIHDLPDLTSLSFPKIDTIPVVYREYYCAVPIPHFNMDHTGLLAVAF